MRKGLRLFALGWALVLAGGLLAFLIQTAGGVKIEDVRFTGTGGTPMSGLLYLPPGASAAHLRPGILAIHGYINSRETQDGFAIAFARAGYVVLALDQTGHGYSGGTVAANGYGGPDGLKYLRGLDVVDKDNIGLEGHSMGGWAVLKAAEAMPDAYRAMVLEGSGTCVRISVRGPYASPPGTPDFPRNLAVVYSRYDEFARLMWAVPRAWDVGSSARLMTVFGTGTPVTMGRLYGDMARGNARLLYTPATTHPGDHISPEAVADAVDWFGKSLKGGKPVSDSLWVWKEIGTAIAFIGFGVLLLGAFELYLHLPAFAPLRETARPPHEARDTRWWVWAVAFSLIPPLTFYPLLYLGGLVLPAGWLMPQAITNQLLVWALGNALITLALHPWHRLGRPKRHPRWRAMVGISLLTVATGYLALLLSDFFFKTDFRFWVVALKLFSPRQFGLFLIYLLPFVFAYRVSMGALARLMVKGDSAARQYGTAIAALAGGFLLFLIAEYAPLFITGELLIPAEALNAIISIQFLPLLVMVAVVATFTWRRTNSPVPGALITGLFLTWYIVAGTAIQF